MVSMYFARHRVDGSTTGNGSSHRPGGNMSTMEWLKHTWRCPSSGYQIARLSSFDVPCDFSPALTGLEKAKTRTHVLESLPLLM